MSEKKYLAYVNGEFVPKDEAKISIFDRGLLYGDAVFEGIRVYNGNVFLLDEHIDRLYDGAKTIRLEIPLSKEEMKKAIINTVKVNKLMECHLRPMVTRGIHVGGGLAGIEGTKPTIIISITLGEKKNPLTGKGLKELKAITTCVRRPPPQCIDQKVKSVNYINNLYAALEMKAAGADACIMLDIYGFVAEGWAYNIFVVKKNKIYTPFALSVVDGITRRFVINVVAPKAGYETMEKNITLQELYTADEIFGTGTGLEIFPIVEVDGRKTGKGVTGPVVMKIFEVFRELNKDEKYLTPVYT